MPDTITQFVTLTTTSCPSCGVLFAMPDHMLQERKTKGGTFYCPNGHSLSWKKTENMRLREQLDLANARARHAEDQRDAAEQSRRALRGVITKQKKRAAAGVCPCCQRTFQNVARHMAGQHPDYVSEGE